VPRRNGKWSSHGTQRRQWLSRLYAGGSSRGLTGGTAYGALIGLRAGDVITNVHAIVSTPGSGTSLFKAGIYSGDAVTRFAVSNDQSTLFNSTGIKTVPLNATWAVPTDGAYMVIIVATAATTLPTLLRGVGTSVALAIGSNFLPFATAGTALSDLPAAGATLVTTNSVGMWLGVS
jgi:hypothetical protein